MQVAVDIKMALLLFGLFGMAVIINAQGNPYCEINEGHTMCLYQNDKLGTACGDASPYTVTDEQKANIIKEINAIRSKVALGNNPAGETSGFKLPSAANMHAIVWDDELASIAQRWANQCIEGHDSLNSVLNERFDFPPRSQNVYGTDVLKVEGWTPDWAHILNYWFQEYNFITQTHFKQGGDSSVKKGVGHAELLVYGPFTSIGCGLMIFKKNDDSHMAQAICNVGAPKKNPGDLSYYVAGAPASQCMDGYVGDSTTGLCVKSSGKPSTTTAEPTVPETPTDQEVEE